MTGSNKENAYTDSMSAAIGTAVQMTSNASETFASIADQFTKTTSAVGEMVGSMAHQWIEQGTTTVGQVVAPIAENPLIKYATKVPGISWLMAALGQVDVDKVEQDVATLKQQYPLESPFDLSHRVMVDTAIQAARIGVITNLVPPLAVTLLAVDLAAVTALQAEMIYRIAAIYGLALHDPARRGEVLAIWGLSSGGSTALKAGLSLVEIIPGIGTVTGATSNAALLYSLGQIARHFYEEKRKKSAVPSSEEEAIVLNELP